MHISLSVQKYLHRADMAAPGSSLQGCPAVVVGRCRMDVNPMIEKQLQRSNHAVLGCECQQRPLGLVSQGVDLGTVHNS